MLISQKKGFYEFVSTILPQSLFNTLMDLSYSAFVSKLFISNNSLILRLCMLDNFASVFWVQPIKPPMIIFGMFSCTQRSPFSIHAIFLVFNRSSERTFFCFSNVFPPPQNHNLICKHWGNCLVIVYFCYCIVYFSVLQLI